MGITITKAFDNNGSDISSSGGNKTTVRRAVLSDVDGTLLKGSLVLDHACFIHDNGVVDLGDTASKWRSDPKNEDYITDLAEAYREGIAGKTKVDLGVKEYLDSVLADESRFYSSISMLKRLKEEGNEVYLISGSPSFLLTPFARRFGFKSKGTLYRVDEFKKFTGEIVPMFHAQAKRKHIRSLKVDQFSYVTAFGDTASDIPLFEVSNESFLVAPTPKTLEAVGSIAKVLDN